MSPVNIGVPVVLGDEILREIDLVMRSFATDRAGAVLSTELSEIVPLSPTFLQTIRCVAGTPSPVSGPTIPVIFEPRRRNTWIPDHKNRRPGTGKAAIRQKR